MTSPTAFIFDMDGTLVDNMAFHGQIWVEYLADLGIDLDKERFHREAAGKTNPDILRYLVNPGLTDAEAHEMGERKEQIYRDQARGRLPAVSGLHAFLAQARALGVRLAVGTSAGQSNIDFILGELGLSETFEVVVGGAQVARGKPFPDLFLAVAERLGLPPAACLVFEDALAGLEAAHRAGMQSVALATTLPAEELAAQAGVIAVARDFTGLNAGELVGQLQAKT